MSRVLVFRPVAKAEYDAAADWYEQQRPGLGLEFIAEVHKVLVRISESPEFYPDVRDGVRQALVYRFPYAVYFRNEPEETVVLAVIHTARNPSIWQRRS